jgi:hypothetical protein
VRRGKVAQDEDLVPCRAAGLDDGQRLRLEGKRPIRVTEHRQAEAQLRCHGGPGVLLLRRHARQGGLQHVAPRGVVAPAIELSSDVELEDLPVERVRGHQVDGLAKGSDGRLVVAGGRVDATERARERCLRARLAVLRRERKRFRRGLERLIEAPE